MVTTRRVTQLAFLVLTVVGVFVWKGNAERWCPFGGIEAMYQYATEGNLICSLGVSNFYILGGVLLMTLLMRRAFCSYMCPIGTISEWLRAATRRLGMPAWDVPLRVDRWLHLLKYPVLAIILYITWKAGELLFRGFDPCYALISRHGKDITIWAYIVSGAIVVGSLLVMLPFCRWLCPMAAVFAPFARFGLTRIRRESDSCIDCGECAQVCPMNIPVDRVRVVHAAHCTSCLDCVAHCPQPADTTLTWGPPRGLGRRWPQAVLLVVMLACVAGAVAASYAFALPSFTYARGEAPPKVEHATFEISGVTCRGSSSALVTWLERDDEFAVKGYWKIEVWPEAEFATVRVTFDPAATTLREIQAAIMEPFFNFDTRQWLFPAHHIRGFDPLAEDA